MLNESYSNEKPSGFSREALDQMIVKKTCRSFWGKGMEDCKIVVGFWQLAAGVWLLVKCGFEPLPEEGEKMR